MTDKISKERRSENMRRIRSKDMKPEMAVRKIVHGMGYRYRLHRKDLPGKPDLVFPSRRKVIFVHGCFWHQHDEQTCLDGRKPKSNTTYWNTKLKRNVTRDAENITRLKNAGWGTLIIWECETKDPKLVTTRVTDFLEGTE